MKTVLILIVTGMFWMGLAAAAEISVPERVSQIPDASRLADFYSTMGNLYGELKQASDNVLTKRMSAEAFIAEMSHWRARYDREDSIAPCPKNSWQNYYTELTPIHYDTCFAWGALGGLHTALRLADSAWAIDQESDFRKLSQAIAEKFENPDLNQASDDLFK